MKVRPGYKQTEVGVIPKEWACEPLSEFFSFISYGFTNPMPTVQDGVFMITAADINDGRLQLETARKTSESAYRKLLTAKSKPRKNDILLTKDGTLGRLALVGDETICINQSVAVIRPNERIEPQFLKLLLESPRYQRRMVEDAGGSTIKHIYITIVDKMPLGLPLNKAEQRTIASALSDMDELLSGLDRLIAKKRDLKQAAMQQLLTGQTRLPGFKGEWEVKRLGELVTCSPSGIYGVEHSSPTLFARPVATTAQISSDDRWNGKEMQIRHFTAEQIAAYRVQLGDLIVVKSSGSAASIQSGKLVRIDEDLAGCFVFSNFLMRLRPTEVSSEFLYFFLTSSRIKAILPSLCEASTYPNIRINEYLEIEVPAPEIREQEAIAEVLSDMDAELTALEQRREKTKSLKQAMMQELLTGRIRLV